MIGGEGGWACATWALVCDGKFQSVEMGEELAMSCSQPEDGDVFCSVPRTGTVLVYPYPMCCRHAVLKLLLGMAFAVLFTTLFTAFKKKLKTRLFFISSFFFYISSFKSSFL